MFLYAFGLMPQAYGQWQIIGTNMSNTNTGAVGIGSNNIIPDYKLQVVGNRIRVSNSTAAGATNLDLRTDGAALDVNATKGGLYIHGTNTYFQTNNGNVGINTTNVHGLLQLSNDPGWRKIILQEYTNNDYQTTGFGRATINNVYQLIYKVATNYTNHIFYAGENTSSSRELMRIEGNGNIGIGNNPGYKLDVAGIIRATVINSNSDERLKHQIQPIADALEIVLALRGTIYQFKTDVYPQYGFNKGTRYGFIAQEVEKVVPDLVSIDKGGYYSLNYLASLPMLVEAFKRQQSDLKEKDKHLVMLSSYLDSLEKQLQQLELTVIGKK